ncbi:hypothetical protein AHiyo4_48020 [Arthrobacter sp. Hiyo4]|nr:hypothetical protein AHiyo4_48020 [Arthrobacter sp. Hiyo4]
MRDDAGHSTADLLPDGVKIGIRPSVCLPGSALLGVLQRSPRQPCCHDRAGDVVPE